MRILLTSRWLGGAGGSERLMWSMVWALRDHHVHVVAHRISEGRWSDLPPLARAWTPDTSWRWCDLPRTPFTERFVVPLRRRFNGRYDLQVALFEGPNVVGASRVGTRLANPCGSDLAGREGVFQYAALEAPSNSHLAGGLQPVLLPPPLFDLSPAARPVPGLPSEFFLTVFNPYDPIKGADDLRRALPGLPLPVVWCHSTQTLSFEIPTDLRHHPKVIHLDDPDLDQMRWLYEHCTAYLSFSRSEGFGWAVADALQYSRHVVSRATGVMSFSQVASMPGVTLLAADAEWTMGDESLESGRDRDLGWLAPSRFVESLESLAGSGAQSQDWEAGFS